MVQRSQREKKCLIRKEYKNTLWYKLHDQQRNSMMYARLSLASLIPVDQLAAQKSERINKIETNVRAFKLIRVHPCQYYI